jgi:DNA-binding NtrC family response regulator
LLADDEAGIRQLLFDALTGEGFKVTLAKDGQESLDKLKNRRFDLLITDIHMPRLNGIELLRKMKRARRKERVIIMTGKPVDQTVFGADTLPVFTQLDKPFEIESLIRVVCMALANPAKKKKRPRSNKAKGQKRS